MAEQTDKRLKLDHLPDMVKVLILAAAVFGAGGGGAQLFGRDYGPQFDKLDRRLEAIEDRTGADHDRLVKLETELEQIKRGH